MFARLLPKLDERSARVVSARHLQGADALARPTRSSLPGGCVLHSGTQTVPFGDRLTVEHTARRGQLPSEQTIIRLRQKATLATRPAKQTLSLAELTAR
jgi:hypothetical protein